MADEDARFGAQDDPGQAIENKPFVDEATPNQAPAQSPSDASSGGDAAKKVEEELFTEAERGALARIGGETWRVGARQVPALFGWRPIEWLWGDSQFGKVLERELPNLRWFIGIPLMGVMTTIHLAFTGLKHWFTKTPEEPAPKAE